MKIQVEFESLESNLQERAIETLTDNSLPATQVIEELTNEAKLNFTLSFIP
jgi:hypothetical protein